MSLQLSINGVLAQTLVEQATQVLTPGDEFVAGFPKGSPLQVQPAGFERR